MANQHIKAASSNLRRVVTDLKSHQQQVRADAANQRRELEKRQIDIKNEQQRLRSQARISDSATLQTQVLALVTKLEDEYNHILKTLSETESAMSQQVQAIEEQSREFAGLAERLESMST